MEESLLLMLYFKESLTDRGYQVWREFLMKGKILLQILRRVWGFDFRFISDKVLQIQVNIRLNYDELFSYEINRKIEASQFECKPIKSEFISRVPLKTGLSSPTFFSLTICEKLDIIRSYRPSYPFFCCLLLDSLSLL